MSHPDIVMLERIGIGFLLSYLFGYERKLRGSPAGDRTFVVVGTAAAAMTAIVGSVSPQATTGILTGVGFIGAGVMLHGEGTIIRGVTTAATIFAVAAVGIVVGYGDLLVGTVVALGLIFTLETKHMRFLRWIDPVTIGHRFSHDAEHLDAGVGDARHSRVKLGGEDSNPQ